MTIEIRVPDIGMDEVEVTEILVKIGDQIKAEEPLIVVEGDKVSMEIPSPKAGIVKDIRVSIGDKVNTSKLIMIFDEIDETETISALSTQKMTTTLQYIPEISAVDKEINVPDIGIDEVEVTEILVKVGDKVKAEQPLIVVEGDKVSMEVPAPFSGTVKEIKINTGDKVSTGSLIMQFEATETLPGVECSSSKRDISSQIYQSEKMSNTHVVIKTRGKNEYDEDNNSHVYATPVIRRLAREIGINLTKVKGTGRKGRILKEDVYNYVKKAVQLAEAMTVIDVKPSCMLPWPKVDFGKFGDVKEVELSRIQKISGANLSRNWVMIPHVTHFDKSDITELEAFRKQQNAEAEKRGLDVKITPVIFIMKAAAAALEQMPRFNSSLSEDGQRLTLKKYINIGVVVDTPNGLVVPVLKYVNKKGIIELSRELMAISKKARDGKLVANEMQGGCFTVSSIGGLGTTYFAPIVNAPEVAILGVSKSVIEPVWNGKEFIPRLMLPISLSFDHRVIDGADGARFITIINNALNDIRRLVM